MNSEWIPSEIKTNKKAIVVCSAFFLSLFFIAPYGNFPLNDDWVYAQSVRSFLKTNIYTHHVFSGATLFSNVCWGVLFTKLFGFSFTVLRLSTVVISLLGIVILASTLKQLQIKGYVALCGLFMYAFNPIYLQLSVTYMTDVFYCSVSLMAFYFALIFFQKNQILSYILFIVFCMIAILSRQVGIVYTLAFALAYLFSKPIRFRLVFVALIPFVLGVLVYYFYQQFLIKNHLVNATYNFKASELLHTISSLKRFTTVFLNNAGDYIFYVSLFLSPLLFCIVLVKKIKKQYYLYSAMIMLLLIVSKLILQKNIWMPTIGNILHSKGLGPFTLYNYAHTLSEHSYQYVWFIITLLTFVSSTVFVAYLIFCINNYRKQPIRTQIFSVFISIMIILYSLLLLLSDDFFDRYLLILIPLYSILFLLQIGTLNAIHKTVKNLTIAIILICFAISTLLVSDYMQWNKTRWQALDYVHSKGFSSKLIDGGYEYNGWYNYSAYYNAKPNKSYWWIADDYYIISFAPIRNYNVEKTFDYTTLLPYKRCTLYVLKRNIK